ncbi:glycosyltransferase [bacterium]|nr:glycosyltransferase [bacterium]
MADTQRIRVKFLGNYSVRGWQRQFPGGIPVWGRCEYLFDLDAKEYDWLVVYNDFPGNHPEERLSCPRQQTILVTCEPSSIKTYGRGYSAQFGLVLTSQAEWALPHAHRIYSQPALQWFYGLGSERVRTYDQMVAEPPLDKRKTISTVCSAKRQRHTLHDKRYRFTQALKARIPEMDIYGHGVREMDDKAEALDDYRYHVAIENHIGIHHWTEKLSDVFLGSALPFYCGCPNAVDYFPEESFIPIDIRHVEAAHETIMRAIRDREYEKRLPHILEARRRVLEQYNLFAVLSREVETRMGDVAHLPAGDLVMSRRLLRKRHPSVALKDFCDKCRSRVLHALAR